MDKTSRVNGSAASLAITKDTPSKLPTNNKRAFGSRRDGAAGVAVRVDL
jgi:hypothetical protein